MKVELENYKTGWYGLSVGLDHEEIDELIKALQAMKNNKSHFHIRSDYEGDSGVGDIEIYHKNSQDQSNMKLDT